MSRSPSILRRSPQVSTTMKSKILIIDDDVHVCQIVQRMLSAENFHVLTAQDGQTGIELAQQYYPDLIFCDLLMPDIDGYEVLRRLRNHQRIFATPFVFLTACNSTQDMRQGLSSGADDYLLKPFTQEELLRTVEVRLLQREQLKNFYNQSLEELRRNIAIALPHELRTPLVGILGASSFLMSSHRDLEPPLVDELLTDIYQSGQRLHNLIQKFLYFVRLQERCRVGELPLMSFVGGISELVKSLIDTVIIPAGRGEDLQVDVQLGAIAMISTDLSSLLRELLENAVKFSPKGTPIQLKLWEEDQVFRLEISDQGRGMTPIQISQIGAYQQFDRDQLEQQGMGLGLAIAQLITRIYRGTMTIDSPPDQGTTIRFTFPQT